MSLLDDLRKNRSDYMHKLQDEVIKSKTSFQSDSRFWQPTKDKSGNALALIRFLPNGNVNELPFVKTYTHGFQNPLTGYWFIDNCPTTIGLKCPVCEANAVLWKTGDKKNQDVVRSRKRRLYYISNILICSDSAKKENEGKVKLFKYGKKIFDKISSLMFPEFTDIIPLNPFDLWEGAKFKLRVRTTDGFTNYDSSEFDKVSPLSDKEEEIEKVVNQLIDLNEFVDPSVYKSYDELLDRFTKVTEGGQVLQALPKQNSDECCDNECIENKNDVSFKLNENTSLDEDAELRKIFSDDDFDK